MKRKSRVAFHLKKNKGLRISTKKSERKYLKITAIDEK
jgi:hypothetical protein